MELTVSKPCPAPGEPPREKMALNGTGKALFEGLSCKLEVRRSYPKHGLLGVYDVHDAHATPAFSAISGDFAQFILCAAVRMRGLCGLFSMFPVTWSRTRSIVRTPRSRVVLPRSWRQACNQHGRPSAQFTYSSYIYNAVIFRFR